MAGLTKAISSITKALDTGYAPVILAIAITVSVMLIVAVIGVEAERAARETARRQRRMHPDPDMERAFVQGLFDRDAVRGGATYDITRLHTPHRGAVPLEWVDDPDEMMDIGEVEWLCPPAETEVMKYAEA